MILTNVISPGYIYVVTSPTHCTAFAGDRIFSTGTLTDVAAALRTAPKRSKIQVFDDGTGQIVEFDRSGSVRPSVETAKGRGRPKLGVVAREVTLLPRHWDWLSSQPGGASVALRKLVDQARRAAGDSERVQHAQEAAYRFMSTIGSNRPNFEDASKALFAYDRRRFAELLAGWPEDIREYAIKLAFADLTPADG